MTPLVKMYNGFIKYYAYNIWKSHQNKGKAVYD